MIHLHILLFSIVNAQSMDQSLECELVGKIWVNEFRKDLVVDEQTCCFGIPKVTCLEGNVTGIDWTSQKLRGNISSSFGQLVHLKSLYLSANKLSGQIPTELQNLKELIFLDLGYNQITDLGDVLGSLKSLQGLSLWYNKVSGPIPESLGGLSNLKGLWLENNQFIGEVPKSLSMHAIAIVDLRRNPNLSGVVKVAVGEMGISDTNVEPCLDGSTDPRCLQINSDIESLKALETISATSTAGATETDATAELAATETAQEESTASTGPTLDSNGYIIGGLVGASGLVATTLLIIFRTPKSVRSGLDDGPDLETITEQNFPDNVELPEVSEGVMFEPGLDYTEAGPAAADIEAVFPSIFSNILGDLSK